MWFQGVLKTVRDIKDEPVEILIETVDEEESASDIGATNNFSNDSMVSNCNSYFSLVKEKRINSNV